MQKVILKFLSHFDESTSITTTQHSKEEEELIDERTQSDTPLHKYALKKENIHQIVDELFES